ncbi:hypothetical protein [Paracoccus aerodenitrificans]|uniref:hypothetical protein n=1 Tax=Paracoccus aerodenitrificans TaxID=3017781 RepID=UPI0022F04273|nr:hypothetical protein [Paracoccus aerodenitrificans]WBU62707.1 hypothetical protein PAE61_09985 [Paracoccus aerodenitrificans]
MTSGIHTAGSTVNTRMRTAFKIAVGVVGLVLLAGLAGRLFSYELRRDEFMFIPPAALLGDYELYRELFFNQPPYSVWLFRTAHLLLPDLGLLASARLTMLLIWVFMLAAVRLG